MILWKQGDVFTVPYYEGVAEHTAFDDNTVLFTSDYSPLLKFLNSKPTVARFKPTLYKKDNMMNEIKKPENARKWINNALNKKKVVMGFGHRVYKSGDSRVPTMREYFGKVAKITNDKKFEKI